MLLFPAINGAAMSDAAEIDNSQLLQRLLLLSAALVHSRPRNEIPTAYPLLAKYRRDYRVLDQQILRSDLSVSICGIDRLASLLSRYRPADLVIATAHHGHFVAFFSACARAGIPLAACYRSASEPYLGILRQSGVALVDLDTMSSVTHLFGTFERLQKEGRYLALVIDAPFASRRRYRFLGYQVTASSMPWLYAKRTGASMLPLVGHIISPEVLGYQAEPAIEDVGPDFTQHLFEFLDRVVLNQCEQYAWTTNSVLLSDPAAREHALGFLAEALAWRRTQS